MEDRVRADPNAPSHKLYHVTIEITDEDEVNRSSARISLTMQATPYIKKAFYVFALVLLGIEEIRANIVPLISDSRPEAIKLLKIIQSKSTKAEERDEDKSELQDSDQEDEEAEAADKKRKKTPKAKGKAKAKAKVDPNKCEGIVDPKKALQGDLPRPCEACVCVCCR